MDNALSKLLGSHTYDEFLDLYKSDQPLFVPDVRGEASELFDIHFLKSIHALLEFWPKNIDCYKPGIADEVNTQSLAPLGAREQFEQGHSLIFNDADTTSGVLRDWADSIQEQLGLSTLTYGRSLVYATPKGGGTDPHFDQNINFVIQLHGTKRWKVAPNTHVINPMTRHTIGAEMDPELATYAGEMPEAFPADAQEFVLTPGSALFVPRGSWHTTTAGEEDSLALNFTYSAPTWIDLLTAAMRGRLTQYPKWRETANFVTDESHCLEAFGKLDGLLDELAQEFPHWIAMDIIQATERDKFPLS
ncbi:MAG: cupin-like domain-containing protein [Planctomycetes bacterium]|nr:cupin-like domain-containing protein [Planctomycetota bacterium]